MTTDTIVLDDLDDCILGYIEGDDCLRVIYSYDKLFNHFYSQSRQELSHEEAREQAVAWIDFNVIRGLSYMGGGAPSIMYTATRSEIDERVDEYG